ncbi:MAG: hypothetical protein JNL74_12590 [Fibrobacteres bacterium]|nr:hypothetical protein [Fibrobacterota bacterium]
MEIQSISSGSGWTKSKSLGTSAVIADSQTAMSQKKDSVELSNRNPANKKELMATYSRIRAEQPAAYRAAVLNSVSGGNIKFTSQSVEAPAVQVSVDKIAENVAAMAKNGNAALNQAASFETAAKGTNNLKDTERLRLSVQGGTKVSPNSITGPKGAANSNNEVIVSGSGNNVNLSGTPAAGVRQQTFELTGGPGIDNTSVSVEGNNNSVKFTGSLQQDNTIALQGNGNSVSLANGVSDSLINVTGSNVSVDFGGDNPLTKSQSGWSLNINGSNLAVSIVNGEAKVSGNTEGMQIKIDNAARTVSVGPSGDVSAPSNF